MSEHGAKLVERLLAVQENERERIARALHDDLGQQVASLSILTGTLKRRLSPDDSENRQQADRIREKLIALAESMGRLSLELYPSILEHAGIAAALRQLCDRFVAASGIPISYESSGDFKDVPFRLGLCLYRIVQDTLGSVAQGDTSEASVYLARSGEQIELFIADPSPNLLTVLRDSDDGLGLGVLQQRVRSVCGEIHLQSSPPPESRLTVRVAC
jgi:two-component system sensor histidine kinase UhpB